jgi:predicted dehydrogenase
MGMSKGNGHPYSWAAIFNGYDPESMASCPFPVIPDYLAKQNFPEDAISDARVTHIWTQDHRISEHIAHASLIEYIVDDYIDMIGQVDAVLLARDDAKNHVIMSRPFLDAGIPIFIDKPIALNCGDLERILAREQYPGQVFSCSALRYAKELQVSPAEKEKLGDIHHIYACTPKYWETYAVHIIEPALMAIGDQGALNQVDVTKVGDRSLVNVAWQSGVTATFATLGKTASPIGMMVYGKKGFQEYVFRNTFAAFRESLMTFVNSIGLHKRVIPQEDWWAIVKIIERGAM